MSRLDGLGLRATLRDHGFGDVPILFISGGRRPADMPSVSFIAKPFDIGVLLDAVAGALAAPRAPLRRTR